jgi:signal recognition particle subunit SRP54
VEPNFTLNDLWRQLQQVKELGIDAFPKDLFPKGFADFSAQDKAEFKAEFEGIKRLIDVMTDEEREDLDLLLDKEVRQRIAVASGTRIQDVEEFLSQFAKMRIVMRGISRNLRQRSKFLTGIDDPPGQEEA